MLWGIKIVAVMDALVLNKSLLLVFFALLLVFILRQYSLIQFLEKKGKKEKKRKKKDKKLVWEKRTNH